MSIRSLTRSEKSARTRRRNKNPLRAAKLQAERPQPAAPDWETLRPLILAKSDGCYLCGRPLTLETMTTDHMTIQPMGCTKDDEINNLMPACSYCNSAKGSRRLLVNAECACGQQYLVLGLGCLRCKYGWPKTDVRVVRTGRFEI